MNLLKISIMVWASILTTVFLPASPHTSAPRTHNVFLIVSDGLRWQGGFRGAEERLLTKEYGGVKDTNTLRAEFWASLPLSFHCPFGFLRVFMRP